MAAVTAVLPCMRASVASCRGPRRHAYLECRTGRANAHERPAPRRRSGTEERWGGSKQSWAAWGSREHPTWVTKKAALVDVRPERRDGKRPGASPNDLMRGWLVTQRARAFYVCACKATT